MLALTINSPLLILVCLIGAAIVLLAAIINEQR